jgi:hypothetical protein
MTTGKAFPENSVRRYIRFCLLSFSELVVENRRWAWCCTDAPLRFTKFIARIIPDIFPVVDIHDIDKKDAMIPVLE